MLRGARPYLQMLTKVRYVRVKWNVGASNSSLFQASLPSSEPEQNGRAFFPLLLSLIFVSFSVPQLVSCHCRCSVYYVAVSYRVVNRSPVNP